MLFMQSAHAWRAELALAAKSSKVKFDSSGAVGNEAHARAAIAVLRAFADDASARLYAEPRTPERLDTQNAKPADLLLLHPQIGALLVEVKGWHADWLQEVEAGSFRLVSGEVHNPWQQAQGAAAQLQTATRRVLKRRRLPKGDLPFSSGASLCR